MIILLNHKTIYLIVIVQIVIVIIVVVVIVVVIIIVVVVHIDVVDDIDSSVGQNQNEANISNGGHRAGSAFIFTCHFSITKTQNIITDTL